MFHGILIGLGIGFVVGGAIVYFYFGKAIAAGKEYLGQVESRVKGVVSKL